jgi:hypothetical protein
MYRPLYSDQLLFGKPLPEQSLVEFYDTQQPDEVADTHQPDEAAEAHQPDEVAEAHEPDEAVNEWEWDDLDMPLPEQSWLAFTETHQPDEAANEWWVWERVPFGKKIHRYSGCPDGLVEFRKLAESAAILFEEMELFEKAGSHHSWTDFLHLMAQHYQMPLLRAKQLLPVGLGLYEVRSKALRLRPAYLVAPEELAERWSQRVFHNVPNYPSKWTARCLIHSVFTSSMTLIEAVLDPDSVVYISFLTDRSSMDDILGPPEVTPDDEATVISSELPINFPPDKNIFKQITGKTWFVQFVEGGIEPERGLIDGSEGFLLIQKVLTSEKQPVSPLDLYAAIPKKGRELLNAAEEQRVLGEVEDHNVPQRRRSGTNVLDAGDDETRKNMAAHRRELLKQIEHAKTTKNDDALEKLQIELVDIGKYQNSVTNLFGAARLFQDHTPDSKALGRIRGSIFDALKLLKKSKKFDKLSEFLNLYLKTQGAQGRQYMKAGEVKWET